MSEIEFKMGKEEKEFIEKVEEISGVNIYSCYQCGKCSAGCTFSYAMDIKVNQIMHYIQLGRKETVLNANSIWICASCLTCSVRCPRDVDVAAVMESLREINLRENPEKVRLSEIPQDTIEKMPNIALVGNLRKTTG